MRCAKCGRLLGGARPSWALPCMCGDVSQTERFHVQGTPMECPTCGAPEVHPTMEGMVVIRGWKVQQNGAWWSQCLRCSGGYTTDLSEFRQETHNPNAGWFATREPVVPVPVPVLTDSFPCSSCAKTGECQWQRTVDCTQLESWKAAVNMPALVEAIRVDPKVGRGSCSSIDECWDDAEIGTALARAGISNATKAVEWAQLQEELFLEQGLNQRWGEDDDPQLKNYEEFQKKLR